MLTRSITGWLLCAGSPGLAARCIIQAFEATHTLPLALCIGGGWGGVGWAPGEGWQYASAWLQTSNRVFSAVLLPPSPFEALSCRGDRCQTGFRARIECHRAGIDLARRVNFPQWSLKCWLPPPYHAGKYGSMLGICRSVDQLHFRNQFQNQTCAPFFDINRRCTCGPGLSQLLSAAVFHVNWDWLRLHS